MALRRTKDRVWAECGCLDFPECLSKILGDMVTICSKHGVQKVVRLATGREIIEMTLGITLPEPSVSDEPPY